MMISKVAMSNSGSIFPTMTVTYPKISQRMVSAITLKRIYYLDTIYCVTKEKCFPMNFQTLPLFDSPIVFRVLTLNYFIVKEMWNIQRQRKEKCCQNMFQRSIRHV